MPTIDYLPLANNPGAFVESQAAYVVDLAPAGALVNGYPAGIVVKERFNKTLRQSSMMAAALANFISGALNVDVLDDGNLAALVTLLTTAMQTVAQNGAWTTGDVKLTMKTVADAGWIMCDDGTIGDAASAATHASDANLALFTLLWNNVADAWAPVVTGRGGSAAADWAAHKKLTLTKMLGRALAIAGAGGGLTARALGENLGAEDAVVVTHSHGGITSDDGNHQHTYDQGGAGGTPNGFTGGGVQDPAAVTSVAGLHHHTVAADGVSGVGKNMPPQGFVKAMIKQ